MTWPDGWTGDLGAEPTIELYVAHLVSIFAELRRVIKPTGTAWVNCGDSYAGGGNYRSSTLENLSDKQRSNGGAHGENGPSIVPPGLKPMDLCLVPERLAIALQADGWYVRSRIAWCKSNPMRESVNGVRFERCRVKTAESPAKFADCPGCPRCAQNGGYVLRWGSWRHTRAWEHIWMLTKTERYYADREAVKTPYSEATLADRRDNSDGHRLQRGFPGAPSNGGTNLGGQRNGGANPLNWWVLNADPLGLELCEGCGMLYKSADFKRLKGNPKKCHQCGASRWLSHYASYPVELCRRLILASTPEAGVCAECGEPWARMVEHENMQIARSDHAERSGIRIMQSGTMVEPASTLTLGFRATCSCNALARPAVVCDPFLGTGTTLLAAQRLGRDGVGIELSEAYLRLARERLREDAPLLAHAGEQEA